MATPTGFPGLPAQGGDPRQVAEVVNQILRRLKSLGSGGGAPTGASYLVLSLDATLTAERNLVVNAPLTAVDSGVNAPYTLDLDETAALGNNARVTVRKNTGADVGTRRRLNLIEGTNITLTVADDAGSEEVDVTVAGVGGANGKTTIDFGAFPGSHETSVTVTSQAAIVAGSQVNAWIEATATADHSADEHWIEPIDVIAGNIVAGTGFTIYAKNANEQREFSSTPLQLSPQENSHITSTAAGAKNAQPGERAYPFGGDIPRLYGLFSVSWRWA